MRQRQTVFSFEISVITLTLNSYFYIQDILTVVQCNAKNATNKKYNNNHNTNDNNNNNNNNNNNYNNNNYNNNNNNNNNYNNNDKLF